jgi:hypothetical protein
VLVHDLFRALLDLEPPGVEDSFFDLGGHSLSGTRLLGRIRRATGVSLTVQQLFGTPTVAGLAALIDEATNQTSDGDGDSTRGRG